MTMQKSDDSANSDTEIWRDGSLVAYDLVPYGSDPYPQSHPDRAATIASLLGVLSPKVETASDAGAMILTSCPILVK